ncbi:MAG: type IV secretory system conjugative DNA transfer family protein [Solirubrobacterales bacterium]
MGESDERAVYVALALAGGALLALIWATGALAGVLFGSGAAPIPAGETLAVAFRLPFHLGDPRAAWPPAAQHRLPGAAGIYVSFSLLAGLLGAVAAGVARGLRDLERPAFLQRREKPPVARWASARELAPLRVPAPTPRRLTLGRRGRTLLAAEAGRSVIVFGPTQTHKTSGLVIPALLEWEGPVLATSVKSDLLEPTLERRETLGEVWVFDPAQVTETERARATPMQSVEGWDGALRVAHWLAGAAKGGAGDLRDADFWFQNAEKLIAPLLFAAKRKDGSIATALAWLDEGPEACGAKVAPILAEAGEARAARAFMATQNREERQRSSVYTTAETILAAFGDPRVAEETQGADYTPEALLAGSNTLYLIAPRSEQERLRTVFSTLIQELLALVEARSAAKGGPIDPGLLLLLDECANIAPFPGLDEVASTAAGLGVQLVTAFHDISQAKARLGSRVDSIINNHHAKLLCREISDVETLRHFTQLIGSGEFAQRSVNTQKGERGHRSQTEGDTYRELAPAHLLRQSKAATAFLVYGSLSPTIVTLRPWYRDRALRELQNSSRVIGAGDVGVAGDATSDRMLPPNVGSD